MQRFCVFIFVFDQFLLIGKDYSIMTKV